MNTFNRINFWLFFIAALLFYYFQKYPCSCLIENLIFKSKKGNKIEKKQSKLENRIDIVSLPVVNPGRTDLLPTNLSQTIKMRFSGLNNQLDQTQNLRVNLSSVRKRGSFLQFRYFYSTAN